MQLGVLREKLRYFGVRSVVKHYTYRAVQKFVYVCTWQGFAWPAELALQAARTPSPLPVCRDHDG